MIAFTRPESLLELPEEGKGYEWVDGGFIERPRSVLAQYITGKISSRLFEYSMTRCPAWVLANFAYRCFASDPDLIRRPSVSLIFEGRLSDEESSDPNPCRAVPDLVVEVIGRNDLAADTERRLHEWLEAGVKVVWVVYPNQKRVREHRPNGVVRHFLESDMLIESTVLPGFACPVADLFKLPGATSASSR